MFCFQVDVKTTCRSIVTLILFIEGSVDKIMDCTNFTGTERLQNVMLN